MNKRQSGQKTTNQDSLESVRSRFHLKQNVERCIDAHAQAYPWSLWSEAADKLNEPVY